MCQPRVFCPEGLILRSQCLDFFFEGVERRALQCDGPQRTLRERAIQVVYVMLHIEHLEVRVRHELVHKLLGTQLVVFRGLKLPFMT